MRIRQLVLLAGLAASIAPAIVTAADLSASTGAQPTVVTGRYQAPNGAWFDITKTIDGASRSIVYSHNGDTFTEAAFQQWLVDHPPAVIDPDLSAKLNTLPPGAVVRLAIMLKSSPWSEIAHEERQALKARLAPLSQEVQSIHNSTRPAESLSPQQEEQWLAELGAGQHQPTPEQIARRDTLLAQIDDAKTQTRDVIHARVAPMIAKDQAAVADLVTLVGGSVRRSLAAVNMLTVDVPASSVAPIANDPRVARISEQLSGTPELNITTDSIDAPSFWNAGITGGT